jgi:signal transduction histidine kinase
MLKKLGKNITIVNAIVFTVVILVGGISIFLTQKILHNAYKIEELSEHIVIIDDIHTDAYRLVLAIHHFLIDQDEVYSQEAIRLISEIQTKVEGYKAKEEVGLYKERHKEQIELLNAILKDVREAKSIIKIFEEFSKTGKFDRDELIGHEEFVYHMESATIEINKIHVGKIAEWGKESLRYMWVIMILYVMFVTFGGLSIYIGHRLLLKNVVNPLKELSSATIEFSDGRFDKRVYTDSKTEIGLLYQSFNKMADKIQEHNKFLRKFNEELERKVKERTHELQEANEQLRRAQNALIRAEKIAAVGQIATVVTHEIKTPLNSLSINIQMLLREIKDKWGTEECKFYEVANLIQCEVRRINNILDSFIGFARFPKPRFMQNDINQIIKEVTTFISPNAKEMGITIELSLSDGIPAFRFDRPQIKEVLMNLSQNAVHAMPHGGVLKIITSMRDNNLVVEVSDTGIGISEKNIDKIFTPFFSTKDGGLGLGLAIVQRIIEGHGGSISCSSKVGEGTVFEIVLPVERG